jgi:predicted DNA-binding protein
MNVTLTVPPEMERKLKQAASQIGLSPDSYIVRLLQQELQARSTSARLSPEETELLQRINTSLSSLEWERYRALLEKRDAENLTDKEHAELIAISDKIEEANVHRMEAVTELARIRKVTVPELMSTLGLTPAHG